MGYYCQMSDDDRQLNLPKREEKILEFWEANKIFEKTLKQTAKGKPFVFYEGPPTANGSPGIHHFEARAFKDLIPRYKTMQGFHVERKAGWDTHGLPVEIQVEKELGLKTKRDIERYGIAAFNAKCRKSVWRNIEEWHRFTKRIGYWLDLEHPYITYETSYIESLWWVISEFSKRKLLYQDFKVVPWCTRCETALSTHELGLGYQTVRDRSVYIRFRLKSDERKWQNASILAWTTTPWTLPGNVALAVLAEENYVAIPDPGEKGHWIILAEKRFRGLVEAHAFPPEYRSSIMLDDIDTFKGKDLIGLEYEPLFPVKELINQKSHRVYPADFVTMDDGSGVVHTAVMYGEDDYRLGKELGLPTFHTVDESGHFISDVGFGLAGKYVKDPKTEAAIIDSLKDRGLLFKEEQYEHEYPFCWRCGTAVLYYARNAWWAKMSSLRKELIANNEKINWIPDYIKHGRFGEFLKEVRDWAFSRERFWGTPLPIWQCAECKHQEVIGSLEELSKRVGPSKNTYLAIRHGESETMMLGIVSSKRDIYSLTERGRSEIEKATKKLKAKNIDIIISSPVLRARESAEIIARALGKEVIVADELSETNFGILNGKSVEEYQRLYDSLLGYFREAPSGGETLGDVKRRVAELVKRLEEQYDGKTILFVSHNDPIWILSGVGQGLDNEKIAESHPSNASFIHPAEILEISWNNLPRDDSGEVNLHRPYVDAVEFPCPKCKGVMKRIPEVCDVWFDSGAMPFAQHHFPFEGNPKSKILNLESSDLPYPADYICEAIDQTRGWFYTLVAVATALGRGVPFRNVISLGHVLDKNGQKMSKSKGNVIDPWEMIERYGTDTIRWYFYTANAPGDPKHFDEKDLLLKLRGPLATLWNSFVLFDTYVDKIQDLRFKIQGPQNVLDRWMAVKLDVLWVSVDTCLKNYDVVSAARKLEEFIIEDFSNWYLRRSRRRFQKPETPSEKDDAASVTAEVLLRLVELMAPFIPFLSEVIYQELKDKLALEEESVHLRAWPNPESRIKNKESMNLIYEMDEVRKLAALALAERARAGIKVRQPLAKLTVNRKQLAGNHELLGVLQDEVNVKEIVIDPDLANEIELDTAITPELREEGFARELVRNIQEMRRDAGFAPRHTIHISVTAGGDAPAFFDRWKEFIARETHADSIEFAALKHPTVERDVVIDELQLRVAIAKVTP